MRPNTGLRTKPGRAPACIWILALVSLAPFIVYHRYFADLLWFGDEWDLLDQISRQGFTPWVAHVFAENFVPLFKILWGGLALLGGGSYIGMLTVLWLTHALTVALLGDILRDSDFGPVSTVLTLSVFGLASCNIETLAWSVQWSAVLSCVFFCAAVAWFNRRFEANVPMRTLDLAVLSLLCAASALSFSRGVLTGIVLAVFCFAEQPAVIRKTWRHRAVTALACLLPSIVTSLIIILQSSGNHQHLLEDHNLLAAVRFASACFGLNPFLKLLGFTSLAPAAVMIASLLKLGLIAHGLCWTQGKIFRLLLLLLLFDLGSCALLGIGRYHTGLEAALSSRYQYTSLICSVPFLGIAMERLLALWTRPLLRLTLTGLVILLFSFLAAHRWGDEIRAFSGWRGREARHTLFVDLDPPADNAVPGIPFMPTTRAKELIKEYNLH
ncbi:MAG: hypothetical protein ACAH89_05390 [Rariglobus sp.]|nr:hypothetical protein [Rariglobus sp.]